MNFKTFFINCRIDYREIKTNDLIYNKFYEIRNPGMFDIIGIPDGCVDIQFLWKGERCNAYVCGSFLEGKVSPVGAYDRCFGVKFNSGVIPDFLKHDMEDIIDNRRCLNDYVKINFMKEELSRRNTLEEKMKYFTENFKHMALLEPDTISKYIIEKIIGNYGYISVSELIDSLGYSHRYTNRVFKNFIGMSIKKYANIIRLQEAIDIVKTERENEVYDMLGYYDQAHFIHDFKKFTSCTPNAYMKKRMDAAIV